MFWLCIYGAPPFCALEMLMPWGISCRGIVLICDTSSTFVSFHHVFNVYNQFSLVLKSTEPPGRVDITGFVTFYDNALWQTAGVLLKRWMEAGSFAAESRHDFLLPSAHIINGSDAAGAISESAGCSGLNLMLNQRRLTRFLFIWSTIK